MKEKFIASCLAIVLLFSLTTIASAAPTDILSNNKEITPKMASEIVALSFMRNSLDENVEIATTTPFFDLNGTVTAYCVSFELGGIPSGYVLISLLNLNDPIVEFSFQGPGIEEMILEQQSSFVSKTKDPTILYLGAGALFLKDTSNNTLYDVVTSETYSINEVVASYPQSAKTTTIRSDVSIAGGILDWADASINSNSIKKIYEFGDGMDYWLMHEFSDDNVCSPTCATNVLWYWGVQRGCWWAVENGNLSDFNLAESIFTAMKLQMATIPPLGTADTFVRNAYTSFLSFRGSNYNTRILTQNDYSSFKSALNDNCPVHTMLRNESTFSSGHDVMAFGYGESTYGTDYLFVMDGWNPYGRFVHFNYYPIVKGIKVWVGSTAY